MTCWKKHQTDKGKSNKKELFVKIAASFNQTSTYVVTGDQCMRKWGKLMTKYKEVKDHNNKSGNAPKQWKYLNEMSECVDGEVLVTPVCVIESSTSAADAGNSSDEDAESDLIDLTENAPKSSSKRSRKRPRSKSSAAEMLTFLESYQERRDEVEQEKLKILREIKDDKQKFYDRFFEVMQKK